MNLTDENIIIHFTSSLDKLKSIIESTSLRISYSKEDFKVGKTNVSSAAHPMVCFSEQSLNDLPNKLITYGKYGIGFSKEWARRRKLSPVIYISESSMAAKGLATLLRARQNQEKNGLPDNLRLPIMQLKCFAKNETGYNSKFNDPHFNFKQENEWRFVPEKKEIGNGLISQHKGRYKKNPDYYNKKLLKYPFLFNISDIEVIFVANPKESEELNQLFGISKDLIRISNWQVDR